MNESNSRPAPKWRPRFSLLTAILLMTIVGLAIVVAQLWREVSPLREANRQLRAELGFLNIEDPTKAYAIALPTFESDAWKWRVYLPPGGEYSIHESSGHLPSRQAHPGKAWLAAVGQAGSGGSSSGSSLAGELVVEARLLKKDDDWVLAYKCTKREPDSSSFTGGSNSISFPNGDWLTDQNSRMTSSDTSETKQKSFEPGTPILLLHKMRPVVQETPGGGHSSSSPTGAADGIVLWIEQRLPAAPAKESPSP